MIILYCIQKIKIIQSESEGDENIFKKSRSRRSKRFIEASTSRKFTENMFETSSGINLKSKFHTAHNVIKTSTTKKSQQIRLRLASEFQAI